MLDSAVGLNAHRLGSASRARSWVRACVRLHRKKPGGLSGFGRVIGLL